MAERALREIFESYMEMFAANMPNDELFICMFWAFTDNLEELQTLCFDIFEAEAH